MARLSIDVHLDPRARAYSSVVRCAPDVCFQCTTGHVSDIYFGEPLNPALGLPATLLRLLVHDILEAGTTPPEPPWL